MYKNTNQNLLQNNGLYSNVISHEQLYVDHKAKLRENSPNSKKYKIGGLDFGKFFTGCFAIWIMVSSLFFLADNKKSVTVQAKSEITQENKLLPNINFKTSRGNIGIVLGAVDKSIQNPVIQKISISNPYSDFPETAQLYDQNPELVLGLEQKISDYIQKYRAFEGVNQRYDVPVKSVIFLETSLKYQVPLSFVLSVARLESRFGTDCFSDANITRICKHKNIYSLGLDDQGNNKTYDSWDKGVYSFGIWYQKRVDEGYTTCQIWRRYNPNGDYCAKVLDISKDVEDFFKA